MFQVGPVLAYISLISTSLHLGPSACTHFTYICLTSTFQTISAPRSLCMYISHLHLSDIYISNHLCTSVSLHVHISLNLSDICISNPLYISVSLHVHISLASLLMSTSQTRSTSTSQTVSISGSLSPCTYLTYISLTSTFQTRSTSASQTVCTSQSLYMYISHLHLSDIYI